MLKLFTKIKKLISEKISCKIIVCIKKIKCIKKIINNSNKYSVPFNRTALSSINLFSNKKFYLNLSIIITFVIIYIMLFYCFPPTLIFKNTTTNGGDTGAHNYIAKFFIDNLLPKFRMTGWDMGWFAGMPMLTFYFPLPFFLIALLSKIVGYNIAFKLITVLGSLILPLTIYYGSKLFRFKYPYPQLAAIGSLAFLYMKSFKIYGGNFLGTFAGEFSYSISFGLIFLFIATLYRGAEKEKYDWLFVLNGIILCCIVLTHLITLIAVLIIVPSLLLIFRNFKSIRYIAAVLVLGFFLSAFWSLPFVLLIKFTPEMHWTSIRNIKELFPLEIIPALVFGAVGLYFYIIKKDKKLIPVIWSIIVFTALFFTISNGRLYNARFLPFIFIFIYLLASYGLSNLYWITISKIPDFFKNRRVQSISNGKSQGRLTKFIFTIFQTTKNIKNIKNIKIKNKFKEKSGNLDFDNCINYKNNYKNILFKFLIFFLIPTIAFLVSGAILLGNPLAPAWARHNYTGYESKEEWKTYNKLMKYLDSLPYGRVMFEFDKEIIQKYGTPRAFELIPFWTHQAGMEGLLVESSLTAPFHYINQAELSVKPRGTVAGWTVPSRNYDAAMMHLKYFNITYIMASSPEVISDLNNDNSVVFLNKIEPYYFYEIRGKHNYVEILDNMPFRYKPTDNWVWDIKKWYLNPENLDNPVIYDDGSTYIQKFKEIKNNDLQSVPSNPINQPKGEILSENIQREKIEFETTGIGQPHLIKVSYFPNWHAVGAEGPYLVSPSFMLVFPTQKKVTLYYGMTYANKIGVTLTSIGWIIIFIILIYNFYNSFIKKLKKLAKSFKS